MDKFDELLDKLNNLKIIQENGDWYENIPDDIWMEHFNKNFKEICSGLNVDTHRWYETSIAVIKIYDRFLGIQYITNMFSESSTYSDCYVTMKFFEMKEVQVTSYVKMS